MLKRYKAAYFTHIRDEANKVMEGIAEAIEIARVSGVHVEVVHLKCSGVDNWGKAGQILDALAAARSQGCDIDCDAYPYTAGANPLKNYCRPGFNSAASRQCWRGLPYRKLEDESKLNLPTTASITGVASRPGNRCRSRYPQIYLRPPAKPCSFGASTRLQSSRSGLRSPHRRQWRHPGSDHVNVGRRRSDNPALAEGSDWFRW